MCRNQQRDMQMSLKPALLVDGSCLHWSGRQRPVWPRVFLFGVILICIVAAIVGLRQ